MDEKAGIDKKGKLMFSNMFWRKMGPRRAKVVIHHGTTWFPAEPPFGIRGLMVVVVLLSATLVLEPANAASDYKVTATATISGPSTLPEICRAKQSESFPQLVTHLDEPNRLTALYSQDGMTAAVGAISTNRGRQWERAPISDATKCSGGPATRAGTVNPLLSGGPAGTAYFGNSWFGSDGSNFNFNVSVHAYTQQTSWSVGVSPGDKYAQNAAVLADPAVPGIVHVVWTHLDQVQNPFTYLPTGTDVRYARSLDGGLTFSSPIVIAQPGLGRDVINVRLARTSDGALLSVFDTAFPGDLAKVVLQEPIELQALAIRSVDGGGTWSTPVPAGNPMILPLPDPEDRDPQSAKDQGYPVAISAKFDLATGPGGAAAIVWGDKDPDGSGIIRMVLSFNGGASWSEAFDALVRPAPIFMPAVTIAADGVIGLFWYDWTSDHTGDDPLSTDAWFAASEDSGQTWTITHLAGPFDLRTAWQDGIAYDASPLGVYQDIVAMPGAFGVAFTVGPPLAQDGSTDVRFARVSRTLTRSCTRPAHSSHCSPAGARSSATWPTARAAAISGATVACGSAGSSTTSTAGTYSIGNVTPGTYWCTASKTGYRT